MMYSNKSPLHKPLLLTALNLTIYFKLLNTILTMWNKIVDLYKSCLSNTYFVFRLYFVKLCHEFIERISTLRLWQQYF